MSLWSRLANVLRPGRLDDDLDEEQRFHIDARAAELEARGLTRDEALAQASRRFGHRLQLRESSRDVRLLPWLEALVRDLRLGVRLLRKDAVVSLAAIVSLGLAIGACTAAFALVDALILRALPVKDPDQLVRLNREGPEDEPEFAHTFAYPQFVRVREALSSRMDTFSMSEQSMRQAVLPDARGAEEKVEAQFVSGNAFSALGVRAAIGRVLMPSDDVTPGGHPVALISHAFWTRRLGGSPSVLGLWIEIEQKPYQIVGVAQAGFTGGQPGVLTDVWIPNMMSQADSLRLPRWNWLQIWARLTPGTTRDTVQAMVRTTLLNAEGISKTETEQQGKKVAEAAVSVTDASAGVSPVRRQFRRPLLALGAIVGIVLLIACSNIANLLLARGAARTREMALRASIGAGRGRLIQQVLVESSVLTLAATALGVLCANVAVPLLVGMLTTNEDPVYIEAGLDWRVVMFVAALGSLTTMIFGLVPAIRASSITPGEATAVHSHRYTAHAGPARSLVAMQIAFSLMILFVAGLLLRSFDRLLAVDLGFNPKQLTVLSIETRDRLEPLQAREIGRQLIAQVQSLPGVEGASMSGWGLFRGWSWGNDVGLASGERAPTSRLAVSPDFFRTMQARLLDGREFQRGDSEATNPLPVIVNDAFARKYFPRARAVGQLLATTQNRQPISYEIVGVVANVRDRTIRGPVAPYLYSLHTEPAGALEVRSSFDPQTLADQVRRELPHIHPSLRLVDITRQSSLVMNTLLRERLLALLSGFFAVLGLALAAVGLYGVTSFAVVRRAREIGIRVTLGAQPAAIVRSIVGGTLVAIACGIAAGLAGGLYLSGFVDTFLFEIEPRSLSSLALPVICLLVVALVAAWSPARRATRIDPAEALRME